MSDESPGGSGLEEEDPLAGYLGASISLNDDRASGFDLDVYFAFEPDEITVQGHSDGVVDVELAGSCLNSTFSITANPDRWLGLIEDIEKEIAEVENGR